jgi:hypothetical protein
MHQKDFLDTFLGMRIVLSEAALADTDERNFSVSRHRSRRIMKKLLKRFGGEFKKKPTIFQVHDQFIIHPSLKGQIRDALRSANDRADAIGYLFHATGNGKTDDVVSKAGFHSGAFDSWPLKIGLTPWTNTVKRSKMMFGGVDLSVP